MLQISNASLKQNAKTRLTGRYGTGIMITIVPYIIAMIIGAILGFIVGDGILGIIVSSSINLVTAFAVTKMVLGFARGDNSPVLGESLSPGDKLLKYLGVGLIILAIELLLQMPINLLAFGSLWVSQTAAADALNGLDPADLITVIFPIMLGSLVTMLISLIITLRLYMAPYKVIDTETTVMDSIKDSWEETKGHAGQIFMMDLSFIGWFILSILTCGILLFYVIPYYTLSKANLYLALAGENVSTHVRKTMYNDGMETIEPIKEEEPKKEEWDF